MVISVSEAGFTGLKDFQEESILISTVVRTLSKRPKLTLMVVHSLLHRLTAYATKLATCVISTVNQKR